MKNYEIVKSFELGILIEFKNPFMKGWQKKITMSGISQEQNIELVLLNQGKNLM
jgi:hypothetical protein